MLKSIVKVVVVVIGVPVSLIIIDTILGPKSPFGGDLELKLNHMITGGPQSMAIDFDDALSLFDETCMTAIVFKRPPYKVEERFLSAGLMEVEDGNFAPPSGPLTAYTFERPHDKGFECFIRFVSFEDIEQTMKPSFDKFTTTRLTKPMQPNDNAFSFAYQPLPEGVQSDRPVSPDPAVIRSFADADGMNYFVVLRPDSYSLSHILQLIVLSDAAIEASE